VATLLLSQSIFVHVPKTGGAWCTKVISKAITEENRVVAAHPNVFMLRRVFCPVFIFGFIRHPLTWLQSRWAYATRRVRAGQPPLIYYVDDFNEWVVSSFKRNSDYVCEELLGRLGYVKLKEGWRPTNQTADFVGKMEEFPLALCTALQLAGERFEESIIMSYPAFNVVSRRKKWRKETRYSSESLSVAIQHSQPIFSLFDYPEKLRP